MPNRQMLFMRFGGLGGLGKLTSGTKQATPYKGVGCLLGLLSAWNLR